MRISNDPIGFSAGDPNLQWYVGNRSTTFTDPSGLHEAVPRSTWEEYVESGAYLSIPFEQWIRGTPQPVFHEQQEPPNGVLSNAFPGANVWPDRRSADLAMFIRGLEESGYSEAAIYLTLFFAPSSVNPNAFNFDNMMMCAGGFAPLATPQPLRNPPPQSPQQVRTVFRGERSSRNPNVVFFRGMPPKGSNRDLPRHANANRGDTNYVATSFLPGIGKGFAGKNGWLYVVRTGRGVEINRALGHKSPFPEQCESAIPGGIGRSEVLGAFPMRGGKIAGPFIPNPNAGK